MPRASDSRRGSSLPIASLRHLHTLTSAKMSAHSLEKDSPIHQEHAGEKDVTSLNNEHHVSEAMLHHEAIMSGVTADRLAAETLYVDQAKAEELGRELRSNQQQGYHPITDEERKVHYALNRKFDLCVLPLLILIYLFNGLDRSNLGNAQTDNFSTDIGIPASSVNTASSLFFATFVPLQPFLAAFGKRFGQIYFLTVICFCWGLLTICHAFVKSDSQLIAVRLLMGIAESGFYPTCLSYLSLFYPRHDLAFRFALFYGMYAVAGAFGGLIAFGIFQIQSGALYPWQYLFILEGCVPIVLSCFIPFVLSRDPKSAWFLKPHEREYAEKRMVIDAAANLNGTYKVSKRDVIEIVKDWKLWFILPANTLAGTCPQGFTIFFPVVVKGLGYAGALANLMTVPPYVCGAIVLVIFAYSSDKCKERTFHILGGMLIIIVGLIITVSLPLANTGGRYAGLLILLSGSFVFSPIVSAWYAGNTPEPGKRTIGLAIIGWGNVSGIIGSELFQAQYGPDYRYPLQITLGLMVVAFAGYVLVHILLRLANRSRAKKLANMTPQQIEDENTSDVRVGDKKYTFVYGL
ncbi:MFS general substrate transporter [Calocera viscosa TUFC12733]|uniref:MFS general substrate transporter n=1 Tax=Calocera viscosa (strain TUFC12733) TaxID=1330018 RepID=A0A167IT45_CALVF|nr:MFS general substrate transporter [Calocera viscosa TUFC12733]